uniref:Uncharacterized protein n=1 Tax=Coccolithus braarudii TaxID=221442 RepID=A0A7S0LL99_9EUKA
MRTAAAQGDTRLQPPPATGGAPLGSGDAPLGREAADSRKPDRQTHKVTPLVVSIPRDGPIISRGGSRGGSNHLWGSGGKGDHFGALLVSLTSYTGGQHLRVVSIISGVLAAECAL